MSTSARLTVAAAAGGAASLAFEPFALSYLLPVAVALVVLTCRGASLGQGFAAGWIFGGVFMLALLPWLQVIGVDAWIMLSVFQGVFYGLLGLGTAAVTRLPAWPVWAAMLWVAAEAVRSSVPFGGFPWGRLAFATVDTPVAPLFAYVGTAGVTLVVALVGSTLAWAVLQARRAPGRAGVALAGAVLVASLGWVAPIDTPAQAADTRGVTVATVQGNVPGEGMDAFSERRAVLENHVGATEQLARDIDEGNAPRPDLVIWPENSTDINPFADPTVRADIQGAVDDVGVPVLVGAMVDGDRPDEVFNQGIVWHPGSGPGERYSKRHPVPFGEYIPFRDLVAHLFTRLDQIPRDMVPGNRPGLLDMGGTTIGDVICFEVAYDGLVRDVVRGGADLLVVQTNNATYMGTGQIEQQFAISRLRAIETHRYVVVAATNGVSGIISPTGDVVSRAPTRAQAVLTEVVPRYSGTTPGVQVAAGLEALVTLGAAVAVSTGLGVGYRRRRPDVQERRPAVTTSGEA